MIELVFLSVFSPFITYNLTFITRKPYTLLTNPTTHYYGNTTTGAVISNDPNTWIPYSSNIPKSIYDPCPYGYRVPTNGSWNGFPANTWTAYAITGGTSWSNSWWPASGNRNASSALLYSIGGNGWSWSSSSYTSNAYQTYLLYFAFSSYINPNGYNTRSYGLSVRCIEEKVGLKRQ